MRQTAMRLALITVLASCSYKPEDPGLCKLNCTNAIITGNDTPMTFTLKSQVNNITCASGAAGNALSDPFVVQFLVAETFDDGTPTGGRRPVPNISVEPIVNGLRSDLPEHNPNVEINGTVFTPARYKGIITPKDNWCTDTCGVVTMEVVAKCPPASTTSDVGIQMHSGALYSDLAIFSVDTQAPTN